MLGGLEKLPLNKDNPSQKNQAGYRRADYSKVCFRNRIVTTRILPLQIYLNLRNRHHDPPTQTFLECVSSEPLISGSQGYEVTGVRLKDRLQSRSRLTILHQSRHCSEQELREVDTFFRNAKPGRREIFLGTVES